MGNSTVLRKNQPIFIWMIFLFFISGSVGLYAQDTSDEEKDNKENAADSTKTKEKTLRDFVPDTARSMEGMLTVHQVKDKYFFELPDSIFGRHIIAVTRIAKNPTGAGYVGEQPNLQAVRFVQRPAHKALIQVITFLM